MESLLKRIMTSVIIQTCGHCKKIFEEKLSIKEARKQQNAMEKRLETCIIGLIPVVLEKEGIYLQKKH